MIDKLPRIACVYDRYKIATPKRKASIEIRITYSRKQKYISTQISIFPNQWKNGKIVSHKDSLYLNQVLDKILINIREVVMDMVNEGTIDIFDIPRRLKQKEYKNISFIDFCEQRAKVRKYGKADDTQERYDRFIKSFKEWGGIFQFDDVTEANIIEYDKYLKTKKLKPYSKWNNYHRFLNSFILDAVDEGCINRNPYRWLNIEKEKDSYGISKYLTLQEFMFIQMTDNLPLSLERTRDIFIFQTYTCLSYTDLKNFDADKIQEVEGMKVYINKRLKTKQTFTIPLIDAAIDILKKYNYHLPVISNVKYNHHLKLLAKKAGVDKPISTHWARHTGATILLNEGVDMKIVSKICGHSSTRITEQVYAKLLDETVVKAISEINI